MDKEEILRWCRTEKKDEGELYISNKAMQSGLKASYLMLLILMVVYILLGREWYQFMAIISASSGAEYLVRYRFRKKRSHLFFAITDFVCCGVWCILLLGELLG